MSQKNSLGAAPPDAPAITGIIMRLEDARYRLMSSNEKLRETRESLFGPSVTPGPVVSPVAAPEGQLALLKHQIDLLFDQLSTLEHQVATFSTL